MIHLLPVKDAARAELRIRPRKRDHLTFLPVVDLLLRHLLLFLGDWSLALLRVLDQVRLLLALVTDDVRGVPLVLKDVVLHFFRHVSLVSHVVRVNHEVGVVDRNNLLGQQSFFGDQLARINRRRLWLFTFCDFRFLKNGVGILTATFQGWQFLTR